MLDIACQSSIVFPRVNPEVSEAPTAGAEAVVLRMGTFLSPNPD